MRLELRAATLDALDRLSVDTLVLFVSEADAPPSGLTGLADWRLAGRLSRWLGSGFFGGRPGEKLLMPGMERLYIQRVVGIGIGDPATLDAAALLALGRTVGAALSNVKVESAACSVPGLDPQDPDFGDTIRAFRDGVMEHFRGNLVLLGDVRALEEVFPKTTADLETRRG